MKKIRKVIIFLLILLVFETGTVFSHASDRKEIISDYIDEFMIETKCNSVSVVIVRGTEIEYYENPDGLYQIGSMTKAFTGMAVQKLISEDMLCQTDKVSELLPGFVVYYENVPCDITIGQLLSHTSGFTNKETDYPSATEGMSLTEWVNSISESELEFRPGTQYAYSNVNYNLLGAVIERVSGMTYEEYMRTEILSPLGLSNTYVNVPDGISVISGSRLGYRHSFDYEIPVVSGRIPAGYFYSNAVDMAGWLQIWMGNADISEEYKDIVSAVKNTLVNTGYYSGWESSEDGKTGHSGGTPNYSSRIVFSEKENIGVCVLTNMNVAASTDGLCNGIYTIVAGGKCERIPADVWSIFDRIFTVISVFGVILLIAVVFIKKHIVLAGLGGFLLVLLLGAGIVMPIVFGADLREIMMIWAPCSFAGGLAVVAVDAIAILVKLLIMRKNENRKKTS